MIRLNLRMTLNTLSTGDLITMALPLLAMMERRILERNLLGVLLPGTIGEGLNLDEWSNRGRSGMSDLVYVVHISQRSFYCLLVCRLSMSLCRAYNQAMSRVYISLCHFGFYSTLFYSVFPPTTSFLLASSPFAIVPAILALVPGKTIVGGK
jgi:hypothetical protein